MAFGLIDPAPEVRNIVTRYFRRLIEYAHAHPKMGTHILAPSFISLLHMPDYTTRQQALDFLEILTRDRDEAVLEQVREKAFHALVEMARWKSIYHASLPYKLLCRAYGLSDEESAESLRKGEKEAVIAQLRQ